MLGTPGNKKGSWHNHPTSPENRQHDKFNDNQTYTNASCWKEGWRNRKEKCKAGNTSRREPSGMPFREITPKFEVILGGIRHARNPWKQERQLTQPPNQPRKCTKTNSMTTKHTHMLLAEKKMEEIERKNARLGTLPGESPVKCHLAQQPNQPRKWTTWQNQWQPNIHTCFLLKEGWRNRKEKCKAGNTSRREPSGMPFREISPKCEIILRGIPRARNPWKQKRQLTQPPNQPRKCTKHNKFNDNQT